MYPENKETIYGKLKELLYNSVRRWELKMKQDIELKTVRLLIVSHSSKKLKKEIKLIKILYLVQMIAHCYL